MGILLVLIAECWLKRMKTKSSGMSYKYVLGHRDILFLDPGVGEDVDPL